MFNSYAFILFFVLNLLCVPSKAQNYIVGGDFDYAPFSFADKNGEASGLDVDILNTISREYAIDLHYELSVWDSAVSRIQSGEIDIITGIIFSKEREELVDFTIPIHTEYYSIFIRKDVPFDGVQDLYKLQLMVLNKDISIEKYLKPMGLYENYKIAKSLPDALWAVEQGIVDYVIAPHSLGINVITNNQFKSVVVKGPPIIPSIYCMAVKKGDTALLEVLNSGVSSLRENGDLSKIMDKWKVYERDDFKYKRIANYIIIAIIIVLFLLVVVLLWVWQLRLQINKKTRDMQIQNRELQKMNDEKNKFFSIIAHDLRSPFNSVIGYSELLSMQVKENNPNDIVKFADVIHKSSLKAIELLSNLMEWAMSQTGRMRFSAEGFNLSDLITENERLFNDIAALKSVSITTEAKSLLPVIGDRAMINTVLRNLISNAIKFTPEGGTIKISACVIHNKVNVSVSDTGVGISKEALDKLFCCDRLRAASDMVTKKSTGLGLLLCKEFMDMHNEEITVVSELTKGTTFSFKLPYNDMVSA